MPASKSIILTGASKGLGLAIAKYLLRDSHKLVLVARSAGPLEKLKQEYPGQVEYVAGDLGDFSVSVSPSCSLGFLAGTITWGEALWIKM
jgi:short-subunit dehydrogenase